MASTIFQNAMRVIKQTLDWFETSDQTKTNNLILDTFQKGIDNSTSLGEGFIIVPSDAAHGISGGNNTNVTPSVAITTGGIGYDDVGSRIFINPSDTTLYNPTAPTTTTNDGLGNLILTPQSTGVINIPVTQSSPNYLWVNYLATIDTTAYTLNKETQAKQFYKQTDGYNVRVTTINVPPDAGSVFLAAIDMTAGGAVQTSNISQVGRTYYQILPGIVPITTTLANQSDRTLVYSSASTYTLEAHIKAVGTGTGISPTNPHNTSLSDLGVSQFDTVNAHRQLEHGNAIIAGTVGNAYPSTSAMECSIAIVNPGSDYIIVRQLLSSEFAIVNGAAYNVNAIFGAVPADASVTFPNTSGIYNLYWDSITKSFAVTTASISSDVTKLWLCTVTYTYVGSGPSDHNALSILIERRRIGSTTEKYQRWITTARPPVPLVGEYGFNLDINSPEYFDGVAWQSLGVLTGAIVDYAASTIPTGYLQCDGSVVSQATYSNLFAVIGITWNTGGEGPGDFRLPDFRRRTSVGSGGAGTAELGNTVGNVGGEETHTLTNTEVPATGVTVSISDPSHRHQVGAHLTAGPGGGGNFYNDGGGSAAYSQYNTTGITASGTVNGGGGGHNTIQPSAIVTKIIKY